MQDKQLKSIFQTVYPAISGVIFCILAFFSLAINLTPYIDYSDIISHLIRESHYLVYPIFLGLWTAIPVLRNTHLNYNNVILIGLKIVIFGTPFLVLAYEEFSFQNVEISFIRGIFRDSFLIIMVFLLAYISSLTFSSFFHYLSQKVTWKSKLDL